MNATDALALLNACQTDEERALVLEQLKVPAAAAIGIEAPAEVTEEETPILLKLAGIIGMMGQSVLCLTVGVLLLVLGLLLLGPTIGIGTGICWAFAWRCFAEVF